MANSFSKEVLTKIITTANERELYLVGHMYLENVIDKILEKRFNMPQKSIDSAYFFFQLKIDILVESGILKGKLKKNVNLITKIRNRYAHKLKPNEKTIDNWIREMEFLITPKTNRLDKFGKYRQCTINTILQLNSLLLR